MDNFLTLLWLLMVLCFLSIGVSPKLNAQNKSKENRMIDSTQYIKLKKMAKVFLERSLKEKKEAVEVAKRKGWKVKDTLKDGRINELQKVDQGKPIYYSIQRTPTPKNNDQEKFIEVFVLFFFSFLPN